MKLPRLAAGRLPVVWSAVAAILFLLALYLMAKGGSGGAVDPIGPSTSSRSALGYAGIADVLQQIGVPVVRSRSKTLERVGKNGVLVIAEPRVSATTMGALGKLLDAPSILIILPKWDGQRDEQHETWIDSADLVPFLLAQTALELADPEGSVYRGPPAAKWDHNAVGPSPVVAAPAQFVRSKKLHPIVASGDRILVGEATRAGHRIWVLSDPDVIANHGLATPVNADFAVALIGALRTADGPVVFDETIHAVPGAKANPVALLFRFPVVVATGMALIAIGLLLWATVFRFGAPEPPEPPLDAGKIGLIANTAQLIGLAGRRAHIVRRYIAATIREVGARRHAPRGLSEAALIGWLGRTASARNIDVDCGAVLERASALAESGRADESALTELARDINRWKKEMVDGH